MKKYRVQIKYPEFVEIFEAKVDGDNLEIDLKEVNDKVKKEDDSIILDLATSIRENYSAFPLESGDLTLIQVGHNFIVSCHQGEKVHWLKFSSTQLFDHIAKNDLLDQILPFVNEDKNIYLNSLLSDLCRNDFSYNDINKKVKYAKISIIMDFIRKYLPLDYKRVLLDETILGDVEIANIPMAFRFSGMKYLALIKLDNLSKVMIALEKAKIIETEFKFKPSVYFLNNDTANSDVHLVFGEQGMKMDYQVMKKKNYLFDFGEKEYPVTFGQELHAIMNGKFSIFGGDERDLMIS